MRRRKTHYPPRGKTPQPDWPACQMLDGRLATGIQGRALSCSVGACDSAGTRAAPANGHGTRQNNELTRCTNEPHAICSRRSTHRQVTVTLMVVVT